MSHNAANRPCSSGCWKLTKCSDYQYLNAMPETGPRFGADIVSRSRITTHLAEKKIFNTEFHRLSTRSSGSAVDNAVLRAWSQIPMSRSRIEYPTASLRVIRALNP